MKSLTTASTGFHVATAAIAARAAATIMTTTNANAISVYNATIDAVVAVTNANAATRSSVSDRAAIAANAVQTVVDVVVVVASGRRLDVHRVIIAIVSASVMTSVTMITNAVIVHVGSFYCSCFSLRCF